MDVYLQNLTDDAKVILLLCGRFGKNDAAGAAKPLSLGEYNSLADWMVDRKIRPADLLGDNAGDMAPEPRAGVDPERINMLLSRGAAMALAVEKWAHNGIWIVCRSDEAYPNRLKKHLKKTQAPPILFGVGDMGLLCRGGLAVVGSRNVDASGEAFTRDVGKACARDGLPIVSGGARGVDQIAMLAALEEGGIALGIMADSLLKAALSSKYRAGIREKRLVLVSPFHPESRFNVGNAMGRNKLIYALSDFALVVSADKEKGGTWTGAKEELKRREPRPVFVRLGNEVPEGNQALVKLGACPFPELPRGDDFRSLLENASLANMKRTPSQASLFKKPAMKPIADASIKEMRKPFEEQTEKEPVVKAGEAPAEESRSQTVYDAVLPVLLKAMHHWKTPEELTKELEVRKGQLDDWIKKAVKEGKAKKKTRPVRYRRK